MKKIKDFKGIVCISAEQITKRDEQGILTLADEELYMFCNHFKQELLRYWLTTRPLIADPRAKKRIWQR